MPMDPAIDMVDAAAVVAYTCLAACLFTVLEISMYFLTRAGPERVTEARRVTDLLACTVWAAGGTWSFAVEAAAPGGRPQAIDFPDTMVKLGVLAAGHSLHEACRVVAPSSWAQRTVALVNVLSLGVVLVGGAQRAAPQVLRAACAMLAAEAVVGTAWRVPLRMIGQDTGIVGLEAAWRAVNMLVMSATAAVFWTVCELASPRWRTWLRVGWTVNMFSRRLLEAMSLAEERKGPAHPSGAEAAPPAKPKHRHK